MKVSDITWRLNLNVADPSDRIEGHVVAGLMADFVNGATGSEIEDFAKKMCSEHPTLQQSFMRLMMKTIQKFAEKQPFDGRNKATIEMSQKIMEALDQHVYLPMV